MKKVMLIILSALLLLAVLFTPIPKSPCNDGGTREYRALTYKLVNWKRLTEDDIYEATRLYWFPNNFKSLSKLWETEQENVLHRFVATVLELNGSAVLVEPVEGEPERMSSDRISINTAGLGEIGAQVGSNVEIYYNGEIMESYPAQIRAMKWALADDLRHRTYTGQWLDKQTASPDHAPAADIVITRIYADCFFATPVIPLPYEIRVKGRLSDDWCVGDQVRCTYENTWYDEQNCRMEADLLTVEPSDFRLEPDAAAKPVIYLYPQEEMEISVELLLDGKLTCTYPAYNTGWKVTAAPDGTLTDAKGQTYNYLYWEGETNARWDMTRGFCVKGEDTAAFLEAALEKLGLNRREANEFIVYWLPLMEPNPYNMITFQAEAYTDAARLKIDPAPDTLIRVFMTWQGSENYVNLKPQFLTAPERTGFTVIEWGGTQLK